MATGASGSGNGRSVDDFTMILALLAGSVIAIFIAWLAFHTELSMAYTYVRRVELWWLDLIGATGLPGAAAGGPRPRRTVIARHIESKPMQAILGKHAYVRTILFAMFTAARSLGVLPPADMRWMRFFDRTLWYVLQNFGRQGAYVEGSAVHVHYLYEIGS